MMDKERWRIQNKLYRMKDKKLELKTSLTNLQKTENLLFSFNLLSKRKNETFTNYFKDLLKLFFLNLDKVLDFYYLRLKTFLVVKKLKKVINKLNKEIKYYEYKL
jgi:hypothetical protein